MAKRGTSQPPTVAALSRRRMEREALRETERESERKRRGNCVTFLTARAI